MIELNHPLLVVPVLEKMQERCEDNVLAEIRAAGLNIGFGDDTETLAHVYKLAYSSADATLMGTPLQGAVFEAQLAKLDRADGS